MKAFLDNDTKRAMKKLRPTKYARIGDKVKVIVPKVFIRCGYPLDRYTVMGTRAPFIETQIYKMAKEARLDLEDRFVKHSLKQAVIFNILKEEGFGGRERRIFEQEDTTIKGDMVEVVAKRMVCEGEYTPGWSSYNYEGDWDGEGARLDDMKHHCIYEVLNFGFGRYRFKIRAEYVDRFEWIKEENKKKTMQTIEKLDKFIGDKYGMPIVR